MDPSAGNFYYPSVNFKLLAILMAAAKRGDQQFQ
jgi:hypothetical protein